MIRKVLMLAALCALAAISLASSASAATFIRTGSTTGPTYSGNITAPQVGTSSLTATDGSGKTVSCSAGTFTANVGASGGANVAGTISALTFTSCSSNTFPVINSCHWVSSANVNAVATGAGTGNLNIGSITVDCKSGTTTVCRFSGANLVGSITDLGATGSHITFTNAPVTSSSFGCPTSAHFSGTYGPVKTSGGALVYINNA